MWLLAALQSFLDLAVAVLLDLRREVGGCDDAVDLADGFVIQTADYIQTIHCVPLVVGLPKSGAVIRSQKHQRQAGRKSGPRMPPESFTGS